jgi:hypothetical protein
VGGYFVATKKRRHDIPYGPIANALKDGTSVPFLGAGASAGPPGTKWQLGAPSGPSGGELAAYLADKCQFPDRDDSARRDLMLVASYIECDATGGRPALARAVHDVFAPAKLRPGPIHHLLARCEQLKLLVTTNYDDLIEQALLEAGRQFHLVVDTGHRSRVKIKIAGEEVVDECDASSLRPALRGREGPVVFKMHGSVGIGDPDDMPFVMSADDYVDLLGRVGGSVPDYINTLMLKKSFLFLGYRLLDWNVRVMLRRIAAPGSNAVLYRCLEAERKIWSKSDVNVHTTDLDDFAMQVAGKLGLDIPRRG